LIVNLSAWFRVEGIEERYNGKIAELEHEKNALTVERLLLEETRLRTERETAEANAKLEHARSNYEESDARTKKRAIEMEIEHKEKMKTLNELEIEKKAKIDALNAGIKTVREMTMLNVRDRKRNRRERKALAMANVSLPPPLCLVHLLIHQILTRLPRSSTKNPSILLCFQHSSRFSNHRLGVVSSLCNACYAMPWRACCI
jgi:hypothetical protein